MIDPGRDEAFPWTFLGKCAPHRPFHASQCPLSFCLPFLLSTSSSLITFWFFLTFMVVLFLSFHFHSLWCLFFSSFDMVLFLPHPSPFPFPSPPSLSFLPESLQKEKRKRKEQKGKEGIQGEIKRKGKRRRIVKEKGNRKFEICKCTSKAGPHPLGA